MAIFYDDNAVSTGRPPSLARMNPTRMWLSHFSNSLILMAIQQAPKNLSERLQATKELSICDRKLRFWSRQDGFDQREALLGADSLKKMWKRN